MKRPEPAKTISSGKSSKSEEKLMQIIIASGPTLILITMLSLILSGCSARVISATDYRRINCAGWKPIYGSIADTEETRNQIEDHDDYYFTNCYDEKKR